MSNVETVEEQPPVAHATIVYLGPVAPHWEIRSSFGEPKLIDDFWARVTARLLLLPKHDPQFRRNRERVNRDAERELIRLDWDLGDEEAPRYAAPRVAEAPAAEAPTAEAPIAEEPVAEAPVAEEAAPVAEDDASVADEVAPVADEAEETPAPAGDDA